MFDHAYSYKFVGKEKGEDGSYVAHLFRFKTRQNRTIIFRAEVFDNPHPIVVVKFFDKAHRLSEKRFSLLTNTGGFGSIVATCINIMFKDLVGSNPYLSFAFMGAPKPKELAQKRLHNTQRFRLYALLMKRKFTPLHYQHAIMETYSCYLILNRDYCEDKPAAVEEMLEALKKTYPNEAKW